MMNGIGGSGDFARNAHRHLRDQVDRQGGNISSVVPMVAHVDHTEHDVEILVTEQGPADLRGTAPRERARVIIDNCVHPSYRDALNKYFEDACKKGGQTPHLLGEAMQWHINTKNAVTCSRASDSKKPPAPAGGFVGARRPAPVSDAFPFADASASIPAPSNGRSLVRILLLPSYRQARLYRCRRATGASCNPVLAGPATMTQIPERILVQAHLAAKQPQPLTPEQEASCAARSLPS